MEIITIRQALRNATICPFVTTFVIAKFSASAPSHRHFVMDQKLLTVPQLLARCARVLAHAFASWVVPSALALA